MRLKIIFISLLLFCAIPLSGQERSIGKISISAFSDYFYNIARDSGFSSLKNTAASGNKDLNGIEIRRCFFTYDNDISPKFSVRFRLESGLEGDTTRFFVKDSWLRWNNIFPGTDLTVGLQTTPAWDLAEQLWGYRPIEKTIMDLRKITNPRDLSISLHGRLDKHGLTTYCVMFGNGSNVSPETDTYKRLYLQLGFNPAENFRAVWFGEYKTQESVVDSLSAERPSVDHNAFTTDLALLYGVQDRCSIGIETVLQITEHGIADTTERTLRMKYLVGCSVYGTLGIANDLVLVARYDYFDPAANEQSRGDSRQMVMLGVSWKVDKTVSFIPTFLYESYETMPDGRKPDPSLTARLTFYYNLL
jgi:hypothetical protein